MAEVSPLMQNRNVFMHLHVFMCLFVLENGPNYRWVRLNTVVHLSAVKRMNGRT